MNEEKLLEWGKEEIISDNKQMSLEIDTLATRLFDPFPESMTYTFSACEGYLAENSEYVVASILAYRHSEEVPVSTAQLVLADIKGNLIYSHVTARSVSSSRRPAIYNNSLTLHGSSMQNTKLTTDDLKPIFMKFLDSANPVKHPDYNQALVEEDYTEQAELLQKGDKDKKAYDYTYLAIDLLAKHFPEHSVFQALDPSNRQLYYLVHRLNSSQGGDIAYFISSMSRTSAIIRPEIILTMNHTTVYERSTTITCPPNSYGAVCLEVPENKGINLIANALSGLLDSEPQFEEPEDFDPPSTMFA